MSDPLLRPRSAVEIIDAAFSIYRANFATLAVTSLSLLGPFQIIGVLLGGTLGSMISTLSGLLSPIVVGATVAVVSDALHDRPVSVGSAFGQIAGRWGRLVLVSFVQGLVTLIGFMFLIVPGVMAMCWTFAAPMTVIVERVNGVSNAFRRSEELARGQFRHIIATLFLSWIIVGVLIAAAATIGLVGDLVGLGEHVSDFLGQWIYILTIPVVGTASGILYFDLRIRTEAYDLEQMAQTLGESTVTPV